MSPISGIICPMDHKDTWAGIIGHEAVLRFLDRAVETDRVSHAYLFVGPDGVGKATVARALFARLLNVPIAALDTHPDYVHVIKGVDAKTGKQKEGVNIKQIHTARGRFAQSAMHSGYKCMLIEDADLMTTSGSNALLKTLEEPSGKACMVITSRQASTLLPTIRSRAQMLRFGRVGREVICDALKPILEKREDAHELAGLAVGCPGLALTMADDDERLKEVREQRSVVGACVSSRVPERILAARSMPPKYEEDHVKTRGLLQERVSMLETLVRDQMLAVNGCRDLAVFGDNEAELTSQQLSNYLKNISTLKRHLAMHMDPHMALIKAMML